MQDSVAEGDINKKSKSRNKRTTGITISVVLGYLIIKGILELITPNNSSSYNAYMTQLQTDVAGIKSVNDKFQPLYLSFWQKQNDNSIAAAIDSLCSIREPFLVHAESTIQSMLAIDVPPKDTARLRGLRANFNWQIKQGDVVKVLNEDLKQLSRRQGGQDAYELEMKIKADYAEINRIDSCFSASSKALRSIQ